jgi:AmmeMemoRadiSam system protein A
MFTDAQRHAMLELARAAVHAEVTGSPPPATVEIDLPGATGAFVTLKRRGQLRGCLGTLECRSSLAEEVARCAASAAREDPRFAPVAVSELADLDVEVSVLGPLESIDPLDLDAIVVGRHGLVVERGTHRGLLLPQVAPEWGWTRDQFLAQTCRKAGLPEDAWRHGARVYRFEADVFG